ncbi:hypothetical protein MPER_12689 [Moniliophthora perniciosa FA553]|nr:hypothetical protein MPER_12689 [Moniliophthora perniciosa FA553]
MSGLYPQSLPKLKHSVFKDAHHQPSMQSAYQSVLQAEEEASNDIERMDARVVGFFMIEFWKLGPSSIGDRPVAQIKLEVNSTGGSGGIYELGTRYRENLLRAFRSSKGPLPMPSNHPSRPSFDSMQQFVNENLHSSAKDHQTAKKYALARDGFRCMLTHKFDSTSVEKMPFVEQMRIAEGGSYEQTNCCHIFSASTVQDIDSSDPAQVKRREHAATALAMLKSFGLNTLVDTIMRCGVHDPTNLLTMVATWHAEFDKLKLWLEATSNDNEYDICVARDGWWQGFPNYPRRVLFVSRPFEIGNETRTLALPDPRLLAIHATCARVAHMSGAAEYMDLREQDLDDSTVLAADGSSAAFFNELLLSASLQIVSARA